MTCICVWPLADVADQDPRCPTHGDPDVIRAIREREPDPMILERERPLRLRTHHQPKGRP